MTLDYTPGKIQLNLYAGDGGSILVKVWKDTARTVPFPMTGWQFLAQIRPKDTDPTILMTFTCVLGASSNQVLLSWTGAQSAALVALPDGQRMTRRTCVGDLQGNPVGGQPLTLIRFEPLVCWNEVSRSGL